MCKHKIRQLSWVTTKEEKFTAGCCGKYKAEKWFLKQDLKNGCVTIIQSEFITHKVG